MTDAVPGRRGRCSYWSEVSRLPDTPTALAAIRDLAEGREPVRPIAIVEG